MILLVFLFFSFVFCFFSSSPSLVQPSLFVNVPFSGQWLCVHLPPIQLLTVREDAMSIEFDPVLLRIICLFFFLFFICFLFQNKSELQCQSPGHRLRMQKTKTNTKPRLMKLFRYQPQKHLPHTHTPQLPSRPDVWPHHTHLFFQHCYSFPAVCPDVTLQRAAYLAELLTLIFDCCCCWRRHAVLSKGGDSKGFLSIVIATRGHILPIPLGHLFIYPSLQHSTLTLKERKSTLKNNSM